MLSFHISFSLYNTDMSIRIIPILQMGKQSSERLNGACIQTKIRKQTGLAIKAYSLPSLSFCHNKAFRSYRRDPPSGFATANPASRPQLLTVLHQKIIQRVDKGERASATESACDIIQVQCSHHGPPKMLSLYEKCLKKQWLVNLLYQPPSRLSTMAKSDGLSEGNMAGWLAT